MFEFLFKYPAEYFAEGRLLLALPAWQLALLPLVLAALAFLLLGYFRLRAGTRTADRVAISVLRGLALGVLVFSLTQPLLEVSERRQQAGVVGVLLDNSVSMGIAGAGGEARSDFVRRELDAGTGRLLRDLQHRFDVRLFRFGADSEEITGVAELDFSDGDSDLAQALTFARGSLRGEPLAGLVVIGDGALQPSEPLDGALLELRSAGVPVYSVTPADPAGLRDIELGAVRVPGRVLQGSRVMAELSLSQRGFDGETVELLVEDDSQILHREKLRLDSGLETLRIPLAFEQSGPRRLEFRLSAMDGEALTANNGREAMLTVDDRRVRILYFEGEPRFEMKFLRRAVADDENLAVTGLIRTADAKYYRVGIESRDELENGFPTTRDELFAYDAILLGSVENALLSRSQQEMITEFVSERGGGLLMLGGRNAFTEGGHRDSPLHAISPVIMPERAQPEFSRRIRVQPTAAATVHPALAIDDSSETSLARWLTLPPLTTVNPIRGIKPGATLLLTSPADARGERYVAMAWQRYGRGKVVAFPVQNSWLWQMHQDIELDDQTHERLWRQLLRWLVESVPAGLELTLSTQRIHAGGVVRLRGEVLDAEALAQPPRAVLTAPDGSERSAPLQPHPSEAGVFIGELRLADAGDYRLHMALDMDEQVTRSADSRLLVTRAGDEYFNAQPNEQLLGRIASETGGRHFAANELAQLVDALDANPRGARSLLRLELWDMPILFLLLVALLCAEWVYRRWRGLV